jgi:membrane-bound serine protease (ClpP class)
VKKLQLKKISILIIIILFSLFNDVHNGYTRNNDGRIIFYTLLKGTINNKMATDFEGVLKEAEGTKGTTLILEIDTFGGRLDSAVKIKDRLIDTEINTIAFINKKAISAGALISLATRHIVMAPGSTIGAATPVRLTYWEEKPVSEKVISYFRKEMKSTAEANNYPGNIAEAMVDPDVKIEGVVEKGKLLTLTTKEAIRLKVAEQEVKDVEELYQKFNLQRIEIEKRPIPWTEKVVELMPETKMILNPTLIWFLLGLVLIFLEFAVPGVILIFFGLGAWLVALTTYLGLTVSLESQLLLFAITSIVLLLVLRKWIKGKFYGHVSDVQDLTKNIDEFTGKSVVVLKDVIPGKMDGMVEFKGATWKAVSDEHIKNGEVAVITSIDGITLNIQKRKEG